jgi:hypothetical protein
MGREVIIEEDRMAYLSRKLVKHYHEALLKRNPEYAE